MTDDATVPAAAVQRAPRHTVDPSLLREVQAAAAEAARFEPRARSMVHYESRGCLLVFGDPERTRIATHRLAGRLKVVAFAPGEPPAAEGLPRQVRWTKGRLLGVEGRLGGFSAQGASSDGPLDIGPFSFNEDKHFDLVLDLGPAPLLKREVLPLGYFFPGDDTAAFERSLEALPGMLGSIPKPRFFAYEVERCAHGACGLTGCERCLSVCPAQAIRPAGDRIEVDPYLCQGCGTCALVCPSGAIAYDFPSLGHTLDRLAKIVAVYRMHAPDVAPILLIHQGSDQATAQELDGRIIPLAIHSTASVGVEVWLAALAMGFAAVAVLSGQALSPSSRRALAEQLDLARRILSALGADGERIVLADSSSVLADLPDRALVGVCSPDLARAATHDKRKLLFDALAALSDTAGLQGVVDLPVGAPLGTVEIDQGKCTLCMACVNLCPAAALAGEQNERLYFREANCVQCGLCVAGCPEKAVRLIPRLLMSRTAREASRLVNQAELARCIACGTPFTSQALLAACMARIKDHPMFQGDGLKLLQMCNTCRMQASLREGTGWFPDRQGKGE